MSYTVNSLIVLTSVAHQIGASILFIEEEIEGGRTRQLPQQIFSLLFGELGRVQKEFHMKPGQCQCSLKLLMKNLDGFRIADFQIKQVHTSGFSVATDEDETDFIIWLKIEVTINKYIKSSYRDALSI